MSYSLYLAFLCFFLCVSVCVILRFVFHFTVFSLGCVKSTDESLSDIIHFLSTSSTSAFPSFVGIIFLATRIILFSQTSMVIRAILNLLSGSCNAVSCLSLVLLTAVSLDRELGCFSLLYVFCNLFMESWRPCVEQ